MPSRSVPFGVKPRTWSATSSPRKPSMGSPASNPYAPTPRACWIPAANTGVLKTVSTTFATSPLMKIARASAVAQAPRSWPPFAISPYRFSASPELATSPQHFAAVLVRAIPSSFASSGCDFDVAVAAHVGPLRDCLELVPPEGAAETKRWSVRTRDYIRHCSLDIPTVEISTLSYGMLIKSRRANEIVK